MAAVLSWTRSAGEAFSKADTSFEDDANGEPTLERVWSKSATPGLVEETEPITTPPNVISAARAIRFRLSECLTGLGISQYNRGNRSLAVAAR
jgi:hypothetical protein